MLTSVSFTVPAPNDDIAEIYKTLKVIFGPSFYLGFSRGLLDFGQLQENPQGQIYSFSSVFVPIEKLPDFKNQILDLGGKIFSEEPAERFVASSILEYAARFSVGLTTNKLISRTLEDERLNLDSGRYEYVESIVNELAAQQRLIKTTLIDGSRVTVNPKEAVWSETDVFRQHNLLLQNIRANQKRIDELLNSARSRWGEEDMLYRFYHHSFKIYQVQEMTEEIVTLLRRLDPRPGTQALNSYFEQIVKEGTKKDWDRSHNSEWLIHTRPMLEAFYHSLKFIEHMDEYAEMEEAPSMLPSGWGHILYLYDLR